MVALHERSAIIQRRRERTCDLVRLEHADGQMALLKLRANTRERVQVTDEALEGYNLWRYPTSRSQPKREHCDAPIVKPLRWTEPIPVGQQLRVQRIGSDEGCTQLELASTDTAVTWQVCSGASALPLAEGDSIDVSLTGTDNDTVRIERHNSIPLTIWLGGGPVSATSQAPVTPNLSFSADYNCMLEQSDCGLLRMPMRLDVRFGQRSMQLRSGERVLLQDEGGSLEVSVGRATRVIISGPSCTTSADPAPRFFAIERPRITTTQIASSD